MPDKAHAVDAKARASQAVKAGRLSKDETLAKAATCTYLELWKYQGNFTAIVCAKHSRRAPMALVVTAIWWGWRVGVLSLEASAA